METKEKKEIIKHYQDKCDCREDDTCGCSYPNNTHCDYDAEAITETAGTNKVLPKK